MKEAIQKMFLDLFNKISDEKVMRDFVNEKAPFLLDEYGDIDEEKLLENIDRAIEVFLPELSNYESRDIIEAFNDIEGLDVNTRYQMAVMFFPSHVLYDFMRYEYQNNRETFMDNIELGREGQIEVLAELGISYKEMLEFAHNYKTYIELYKMDNSLFNDIIEKKFSSYAIDEYMPIILNEYLNGSDYALSTVLEQIGDNNSSSCSVLIDLLIKELVSINRFDVSKLVASLELSGMNFGKFISCVTDENVMRRMIEVEGARALVFCKDFSPEIVELASDFSFDDYKMIDGDYKNSPELLKLISEKYPDKYPVYYCKSGALTPETADSLSKFGDDTISDVGRVNNEIHCNYLLLKELKKRGKYFNLEEVDNLFTDVNAFNFFIECLRDGTGNFYLRDFRDTRIAYYIFNKEYSKLADCSLYSSVSKEVAEAIVSLGFDAENYVKYFEHHEELSNIFLEQGHTEVLFMRGVSDEYLEAHSDVITYDLYLKLKEANPSFVVGTSLVKKFVEQGYYEILKDIDVLKFDDVWDLSSIGLEKLTYEQFSKADPIVRTVPALMLKFREEDPKLFDRYSELFPDKTIVVNEKINKGSVTYEEFMKITESMTSSYVSVELNEDLILSFLKDGHIDFISKVDSGCFTPAVLDYIIDNLDINNLPEKVFSKLHYYLVNRLIDKKDYRFMTADASLTEDMMEKLVASGFTLDDFVKSGYDRINYLNYYVSKENETKIVQLVKEYNERHFYVSLNSDFVVKCINSGFELENINYLISVIDVKVVEVLKNLPKDKYDLLNDLEIKNMFVNKTVTDVLLNVLSLEKVKKCLAYCPDDIRMYVIKKMVNLGHNDFIDCYVSGFDEEIVKKALLSGYFPSDSSLANASYRSKITSLKFGKEELDYLRTRLDVCPYLVMYFEDICNDPKLLNEYLIKEPGLLLFFESDIINNVSLLYEIYKKSEEVFVSLICRSDITDETIVSLYLNYDLDLKYIKGMLNGSLVENLVVKYPYLIDDYYYSMSSAYFKAFEHGYKLNDRSSTSAIVIAFQHGFYQPGDDKYLKKVVGHDLTNLLSSINYDLFLAHKDLFLDNYFNTCYSSGYNRSFYSSNEQISRYMNLNFYVSSIPFETITEEEKNIIVEAFNKYGHDSNYVASSYFTLIRLFGNEFLVKQFLEDKVHMSILKHVTITETDKEAISNKIQADYSKREYSIDEKIELLALFRSVDISNDFVLSIYDELYELYKTREYRDRLLNVFTASYLYEKLMNDDDFELTLMERVNFYSSDDKNALIAERLLQLMQVKTYDADDYYSVCRWFYSNGFYDECNKLAMSVFELDPMRLSSYVSDPTPEFLDTIPGYLREYPSLINRFDIVLVDKQLVIDLINSNYTAAFDSATDEIKNDIDVCNCLVAVSPNRISSISLDNPNYRDYLKIALSKSGILLESEAVRNPELLNDLELIKIAIVTHPNIIAVINKDLIDDSLLTLITDYSLVDFTKIDVDLFEKILVVMVRNGINEKHAVQIFAYVIQHSDEERLFNNEILIKCIKDNINNPNLFKQVVILSKNKNIRDNLDEEEAKVMDDALHILNNTGKINTLEMNPIFSYDLVKYVYPVIGLGETINLMNYTTNANNELIRLIKDGKGDFVNNYISMLREYNIFENNDKFIHYAFRDFASIESLITEILELGRVLTDNEIGDLKKIILKNRFNISNVSELSAYDTIMVNKINQAFESNDLNAIKNYLSVFFGYSDFNMMKREFNNFQFGNMSILRYVLNDIKKNYSEDIYNKLKITNEEMALIILMQRIIESNDVNFLKELVDEYIINNENDKDFYDDVQNLTSKFRLLMNYQFNSRLTKFDDKLAGAAEYGDTGVKIIEFNGESFNFLAHRLYSYDPTNAGFSQMLMADPSLWTALDGASTLSCSSFSDKGFHFLNSDDPSGVVYLFNELPEEFMLFMYGRDLYVEHGGHKMEPTAEHNSFTDIDGLNQNSCYHSCRYNEVAGFRTGMIPCAFVCIGDHPNEETIRAAQYFSQMTGKEIPIIKFDRHLYSEKREEAYNRAMSEINNTVSVQLINDCFLSGEIVPIVDTTSTILKTLCRNLADGSIDEKEALACMSELQSVINRSCLGGRESSNAKLALNKIAALKKTMVVMSSLSKEEVIKIETANMGESGIMYKFTEGEDTYLLKPAVDKQKNQGQPFRAEVQEAASKLQKMLNPDSAVEVEAVGSDKFKISKQELIDVDPTKKTYLQEWVSKGGQLDSKIADQLMREYVVDMLLCNFDCFAGNFVIDSSGNLRGIDKEQSFRFIDSPEALKADFSYVPNGDARIPIYQYIFSRYNSGELDISFDAVYETLDALDCLSDADYKSIFEAYAKSLSPDNYEELLEKIVKRKHDVATNIRRYIDSLISKKNAEEFRI